LARYYQTNRQKWRPYSEDPMLIGKRQARVRLRRRLDPAWADQQRAQSRRYQQRNAARNKARTRAWYRANTERWIANNKAWAAENPERARRNALRAKQGRRARLNGAFVERIDPMAVFARDQWMCGICGMLIERMLRGPNPHAPSLDHIVPLILGGRHEYANVQAAHLGCNVRKGPRRNHTVSHSESERPA
jgi:5-methylcytosine-specific restriction endonuclease McrA